MIFFKKNYVNLVKDMIVGIPESPLPFRNESLEWIGHDNEKNFNQNLKFQHYKNIIYKINSKGYRCSEFDEKSDYTIVCLGCSIVFGYGLPKNMIFHELLSDRIQFQKNCSITNFNLGVPSGSNQLIARLASVVIKILKPNLLIVNYTYAQRREYVSNEGKYYPYFSKGQKDVELFPFKHFNNLSNSCDDLIQSYLHMDHVKNIAKANNINYLWSTIDENLEKISGLDKENYVGFFKNFDFARDGMHPGQISNQKMFEKYWHKLQV